MGDSGSLMIGLVNSILVIKFINVANSPLVAVPIQSAVAIGFSILIVPLLDTLRVFGIRIFNGRSPFTPDRNHVHHLLLDRGLGHAAVTFTCVAINIAFIALAYFGRSHWALPIIIDHAGTCLLPVLACFIIADPAALWLSPKESMEPLS